MVLTVSLANAQQKSKTLVVAVIDTGIDAQAFNRHVLCKTGHKDFTGTGIQDRHGHGTHISGLIDQYAKSIFLGKDKNYKERFAKEQINYCQVILKFFDTDSSKSTVNAPKAVVDAIKWATKLHVDVINYSGGGQEPSLEERAAVMDALKQGITIVAAAGNEHDYLDDQHHSYYPAMYDKRIIAVGNWQNDTLGRSPSSNWGPRVNAWEVGTNVISFCPGKDSYCYMSGTSQATAVRTGKIVRKMLKLP